MEPAVNRDLRSDKDLLREYKIQIFDRWQVQAKPGEVIRYSDGVKLHKAQKELHFGEDHMLVPGIKTIVPAAQRAGKSIWLGAEYAAYLGIPGTQMWHCAPTYKLCGKAWAYTWDMVVNQKVHGDVIERAVDSTEEREIRLRWGDRVSWLRCESTDPGKGYRNLVGDQLDGVGWDECGDQPDGVAKRYLLPRLMNRIGWFAAISEPKEFNWFYEYSKRADDPQFYADGWRTYTFSMADNPFIDPEEIAKLERTMSPEEAARVIYGKFSSLAGQVWPMYRDRLYPHGHLYDPNPLDVHGNPNREAALPHGFRPLDGTRYRFIDIGIDHPTACLWVAIDRENNDRYYYQDYLGRQPTHEDHAKEISAHTQHPIFASYVGNDAKRRSSLTPGTRDQSPWAIYRENGVYCRVTNDGPDSVSAAVSAIGTMLANTLEDHPDGPRIFISRDCQYLRDGILRATYMRKGVEDSIPTEKLSKYEDDASEAFRRSGLVHLRYVPPTRRLSGGEVERISDRDRNRRSKVKRRGIPGLATVPYA